MNINRKLIALASVVVITGCSPITNFTKTGDITADPRALDCDFKIYTSHPKHDFDEIGVIDLSPNGCFKCPDTASNVKEFVQEDVCKAGGNAILLWEANGHGNYLKTTVIKTK